MSHLQWCGEQGSVLRRTYQRGNTCQPSWARVRLWWYLSRKNFSDYRAFLNLFSSGKGEKPLVSKGMSCMCHWIQECSLYSFFNMSHTRKERKTIKIGISSHNSAIRLLVEVVALGKIVKSHRAHLKSSHHKKKKIVTMCGDRCQPDLLCSFHNTGTDLITLCTWN